MNLFGIDISENDIITSLGRDVLDALLVEHATGGNIFWFTSDYEHLGQGYGMKEQIMPELISGENNKVVVPRVLKRREQQSKRVKKMAEVFTPSWICNTMINSVDEAWFGLKGLFNHESKDSKTWITTTAPIAFTGEKTWLDYLYANRLEITCGEAPFIVSRYDTTTGDFIPIKDRIGILDRKLRIVNENTTTREDWLEKATIAFKSIYGYEWQGDSLFLAREALLITFLEYYEDRFGRLPEHDKILEIAQIISWNLWQMDGLKCVLPMSCDDVYEEDLSLFGNGERKKVRCAACSGKKRKFTGHIGIKSVIRDWFSPGEDIITFESLLNYGKEQK